MRTFRHVAFSRTSLHWYSQRRGGRPSCGRIGHAVDVHLSIPLKSAPALLTGWQICTHHAEGRDMTKLQVINGGDEDDRGDGARPGDSRRVNRLHSAAFLIPHPGLRAGAVEEVEVLRLQAEAALSIVPLISRVVPSCDDRAVIVAEVTGRFREAGARRVPLASCLLPPGAAFRPWREERCRSWLRLHLGRQVESF